LTNIQKIDFQQKLVAKNDMPLLGKKVLFTSPRHYAGNLAKCLTERGARPVWMPTIAIYPLDDYSQLDEAIKQLDSYDWVAITSLMGSQAFVNRMRAAGLGTSDLRGAKLTAFGPDAIPLDDAGYDVTLKPKVNYPSVMIEEMNAIGPKGARVLVPVPVVKGVEEPFVIPEFINGLAEVGMVPVRIDGYRTEATGDNNSPALEMLNRGDIDITVLTSSAEIFSLLKALDGKVDAINKTTVAYMGGYTAKTGRKAGFNVDIVPEQYNMEGVLAAIESYFRNK
jgi:uroporphyrinogen-III synthase